MSISADIDPAKPYAGGELAVEDEPGALSLLELDYEVPPACLSGKRVRLSCARRDAEEALIARKSTFSSSELR